MRKQNSEPIEKALRGLLNKLRAELGFIISAEDESDILGNEDLTTEEFAEAVFVSSGLDPKTGDIGLFRIVRNMFRERFGHRI